MSLDLFGNVMKHSLKCFKHCYDHHITEEKKKIVKMHAMGRL